MQSLPACNKSVRDFKLLKLGHYTKQKEKRWCICQCVCVRVCVYVRVYVCLHVRACMCMCACMYGHVCVCMHACMYVCVCVCACVCVQSDYQWVGADIHVFAFMFACRLRLSGD